MATRVRVIRRADHHSVNILLLEHFPEIRIAFRIGKFLHRGIEENRINIAEGDDVLAVDSPEVGGGAIGRADDGDVKFLVGRNFAEGGVRAQQPGAGSRDRGMFDKLTAIQAMVHHKQKAKSSIVTAVDG